MPFIFIFFVVAHFFCLHYFMSSDGFYDRFALYVERLLFYVWYLMRDLFFLLFFFVLLIYVIFIWWYFVFHEESWLICNVVQTSEKIIPEWFFLSFFGFLKSVPDKFGGVIVFCCIFCSLFLFVMLCCL
jgi:ubiquinol-cytochrome c reductase cytochrome b subunit